MAGTVSVTSVQVKSAKPGPVAPVAPLAPAGPAGPASEDLAAALKSADWSDWSLMSFVVSEEFLMSAPVIFLAATAPPEAATTRAMTSRATPGRVLGGLHREAPQPPFFQLSSPDGRKICGSTRSLGSAGTRLGGMEFFCYHRDRPGSAGAARRAAGRALVLHGPVREEMIARGPTLAATATRPPAACTSSTCPIPPPPGRSPSTSRATRRASTGTCCCAGGAIAGAHHVGLPRRPDGGNRYLVLGLGRGRPPTSPCRPTGTS